MIATFTATFVIGFTLKLKTRKKMEISREIKAKIAQLELTTQHTQDNGKCDYSMYCEHIQRGFGDFEERQKKFVGYRYTESKQEFYTQKEIFKKVGDMMLSSENKEFIIDDDNSLVIGYIISYLNCWENFFQLYSNELTGGDGDLFAPIYIMGEKGSGKTVLMNVASEFAMIMNLSRWFVNTSTSELVNYFRVNSNLDYFTYNTKREYVITGDLQTAKAFGVCLHDLGFEQDSTQNIYGTKSKDVIEDFLMARYEIYQNKGLMYHITANPTPEDLAKNGLSPRLVDRLKHHNKIFLPGSSRR